MNTKNAKKPGNAERFGVWLGRAWRGYAACEQQVTGWLVARSLPRAVAITLLWIVKLAVLVVLLYVVFWLVLLLMFMAAVAWSLARGALGNEEQDSMVPNDIGELRNTLGYDPKFYNDTSHEMYKND